jgi:outer membrane autotransporter protein
MKKNLFLIALFLILASAPGFSQFTFTAAPGLNLNSASFGYRFNKFVPYIGIQYCGISGSYSLNVNYTSTTVTDESNEEKFTGKIIMPSFGIKYFAVEKNKVKGYINATVAKPFLSAKLTIDGDDVKSVSDEVGKVSLFAGSLGVGAEYFFDDNFSVGGEFGLQFISGNYKDNRTSTNYNGHGNAAIETTVKAMAMPTYSKISLNFYF